MAKSHVRDPSGRALSFSLLPNPMDVKQSIFAGAGVAACRVSRHCNYANDGTGRGDAWSP